MILVDANVLLYAYDSSSERHGRARSWLERTLNGDELVRLPLVSVLAFLRISSHTAVFRRPLKPERAIEIAKSWLELPTVDLAQPGERHWSLLADLVREGQARGPLVMDAHVASLALEHGATLATTDRDFSRFPGVRLLDPTAEA